MENELRIIFNFIDTHWVMFYSYLVFNSLLSLYNSYLLNKQIKLKARMLERT